MDNNQSDDEGDDDDEDRWEKEQLRKVGKVFFYDINKLLKFICKIFILKP